MNSQFILTVTTASSGFPHMVSSRAFVACPLTASLMMSRAHEYIPKGMLNLAVEYQVCSKCRAIRGEEVQPASGSMMGIETNLYELHGTFRLVIMSDLFLFKMLSFFSVC